MGSLKVSVSVIDNSYT